MLLQSYIQSPAYFLLLYFCKQIVVLGGSERLRAGPDRPAFGINSGGEQKGGKAASCPKPRPLSLVLCSMSALPGPLLRGAALSRRRKLSRQCTHSSPVKDRTQIKLLTLFQRAKFNYSRSVERAPNALRTLAARSSRPSVVLQARFRGRDIRLLGVY